MILLPVTFDYMQYFTEYFEIAAPFVALAVIFAGYRHLKKAGNMI